MTLWCVEVGPVANAREGSMQEHDWARLTNEQKFVAIMSVDEKSVTDALGKFIYTVDDSSVGQQQLEKPS